jgi:hypothetical protein
MKPDQNKTGVSKMAAAVSSRTNFRIVTAIFTASTAAVTSAASFAWKPKKIAGQAAPRASCQPQACIAELWTAFPAGLRWVIAAMRSTRHAATAMSPYRLAKTPRRQGGSGLAAPMAVALTPRTNPAYWPKQRSRRRCRPARLIRSGPVARRFAVLAPANIQTRLD